MKNSLWFVILLAGIAVFSPALAPAQGCQMYTYSDMWLDDSANVVATNYTDADASCGDYSAYADVTVTMPSGYTVSASVNAGCCAEAITFAAASNEAGHGTVSGNNNVALACGSFVGNFFVDMELALTQVKMRLGTEKNCSTEFGSVRCEYDTDLWCTPATSPPDYQPTGVRRVPQATPLPAYYWMTLGLCDRILGLPWECVGAALYGSPAPDTYPKFACTRNP